MPLIDSLKAGTSWPLRRMMRRFRSRMEMAAQSRQSPQTVFTKAYEEGRRRSKGNKPKIGANAAAADIRRPDGHAASYVACVNDFIRRNRVLSVVDLGCGNFRIGRRIASQAIHYVGVDIVQPLIQANKRRFVADNVQFRCLDIITDDLPYGELCLVREVLQHLSNDQILAILPKLRRYRWVIVTELQLPVAEASAPNRDKPHGPHSRVLWDSHVDLSAHPFYVQHMERLLSVPAPRTDDPRPVFSNSFLLWNTAS